MAPRSAPARAFSLVLTGDGPSEGRRLRHRRSTWRHFTSNLGRSLQELQRAEDLLPDLPGDDPEAADTLEQVRAVRERAEKLEHMLAAVVGE